MTTQNMPTTQYWKGTHSKAENKLVAAAERLPASVEFYLTASRKGVPMLIVKSSEEDDLMFSIAYMRKRGNLYRVFHGYQRYAVKGRQVRRDFTSVERLIEYIVEVAFMTAKEVAKIKPSFTDSPAFHNTQNNPHFRYPLDPKIVELMMADDPIGPH